VENMLKIAKGSKKMIIIPQKQTWNRCQRLVT
jgi:hypothetical protein